MATVETAQMLPRWDMDVYFAGLDSAGFKAAFDEVISDIHDLEKTFDRLNIRRVSVPDVDAGVAEAVDAAMSGMNAVLEKYQLVVTYIYSFISTDSRNDAAQALMSQLDEELVTLEKLDTRLDAFIGSLDTERLLGMSEQAQEHEFYVRQTVIAAKRQMSEPEEDLAASLLPSSAGAWSKLHGNITSRLTVDVALPDGETSSMPMSAVRNLAYDPDPAVRKAAYHAELAGWETVEVPLAAALNGIKGYGNVVNKRRGWDDSVATSLFANAIDPPTLEAMQQACIESFPDFRRYLKAKAKILGTESLAWWDMFAPLGASEQWDYDRAKSFVVDQFATYSDRMAGLAQRAFDENWVDVPPRDGKRDGAFCMKIRRDESRVMMNFEPSFNSVQTLAHELGHAYHNLNSAPRTPMQQDDPMALAETASTFCQTIVFNAALAESSGDQKLAMLEEALQDACQIIVDIHSRFLFEKGVFEGREKRDLSAEEMKELMLQAQRDTYGDGLDEQALHPYMWAVKGHYYSPGLSYYNWPYAFGMLFAFGLYARYRQEPDEFRKGYDDLLSSTGMYDAASLAARFGMDIRSVDFWRSSLDVCRERVIEFEAFAN